MPLNLTTGGVENRYEHNAFSGCRSAVGNDEQCICTVMSAVLLLLPSICLAHAVNINMNDVQKIAQTFLSQKYEIVSCFVIKEMFCTNRKQSQTKPNTQDAVALSGYEEGTITCIVCTMKKLIPRFQCLKQEFDIRLDNKISRNIHVF